MSANSVCGAHGAERPAGEPGPQAVSLDGVSFGDVLRAINPLQYVPVIGTIYRVATGDSAPTSLRTAVSAVVGTLTGGPLGLLTSIAGSLVEGFFHIESGLRTAVAGNAPAPVSVPPTHAAAEADLGHLPAAPNVTEAMAAYRSATVLGAI